ncbi:cytidylyltransferase domain-containing protein [Holdemania filiformis]|uniref:Acylneuraminate cytidylyltransferase family protein n=1 Tax=Holdemania filiformis TaxID=61171 RepID=A0A412G5M3_9FIRM|nr:acylneuraminate cytidylyltransferase family protein [Holdemania filiformis]MBS5002718.1 acylneuraminate cytidylyltransferase family protein [Holdemania filiformis]RGR76273.1 acylneuraminate cytidylyltransferase family protein [Holdemania filiformis]
MDVVKTNNLAIIPARSGSKGLKDKNIKLLCDKPLIAYSISAALDSGLFNKIMVSTDSLQYAEIAREYGAEVPFLRSEKNSSDTARSWDVVEEVLEGYLKKGQEFDTVCLLQPTSPLRKPEDIIAGYRELALKDADAVTGVCEMDHSPLWATPLEKDLSLEEFRKHMNSVPRQMLKTYYRINGALYIRKISYADNKIRILDGKEYACIMDKRKSVDIDTLEDFEYASFLMGA